MIEKILLYIGVILLILCLCLFVCSVIMFIYYFFLYSKKGLPTEEEQKEIFDDSAMKIKKWGSYIRKKTKISVNVLIAIGGIIWIYGGYKRWGILSTIIFSAISVCSFVLFIYFYPKIFDKIKNGFKDKLP